MNSRQFTEWLQAPSRPKPLIMGILNVTPNSFYDGGRYQQLECAVERANQMIDAGADIIDVGGESSKPGAFPISTSEELARVIPIIKRLREQNDIMLSIDTTKASVMSEAIIAGATMINDITALADQDALYCAAEANVPVCLMHMQGMPLTMQTNPQYQIDVVEQINQFFQQRIEACLKRGIAKSNLILDPGFGFGKLHQHNLRIVQQLANFRYHNLPLLLGVSRKSTLGNLLNQPVNERMVPGLTMAIFAVLQGVAIIRTHDVRETKEAFMTLNALDCTKPLA